MSVAVTSSQTERRNSANSDARVGVDAQREVLEPVAGLRVDGGHRLVEQEHA